MKSSKPHSQEQQSVSATGSKMQLESLLHDSKADPRFRLVFESAPIGMAIVSLDFKLQKVNAALCKALGYEESELVSNDFVSITHPDDVRKGRHLLEKLLADEIPSYRVEKRFITKQGSLLWLDITVVLIRGEQNEPVYALAMIENITQRKRAEEALRTSEERYRSFVANSSEGIWRFEVEQPIDIMLPVEEQVALFYKHAYLAECNEAMARMYGHERADDLVGARFGEFILASNPATTPALRKFFSHAYRLHDFETTQLDMDGTAKHFSNNVIGIVINGQLLRVWGMQRDETERRQVENEIRSSHAQLRSLAARLQSIREQERTEIAREMHDVLGQSLTGLKLDLSWLSKHFLKAGDDGGALRERTERMNRQLDRLVAAVKTLSTELRPGILDKFGLAPAVEWQCQEFERRSGIKCRCEVPSQELILGTEVATAAFRILQESLSNVVRHSEASAVKVELTVGKRDLMLIVFDNGKGITRDQILDPASLGLLGMRERAELLGGTFVIEPNPVRGTITRVQIPISSPRISVGDDNFHDQGARS